MLKSTTTQFRERATNFLAAFFVVFGLSFALMSFFGNVLNPENSSSNVKAEDGIALDRKVQSYAVPTRVLIAKIGVDQPILNPSDNSVSVLDQSLLKGVVRYPESGLLGEKKNMFLFGHSTGYKVVQNQAFKAFNRLNELEVGDEIIVMSETEAYVYAVTSKKEVSAQDAYVEFNDTQTITLSTCNAFGQKEDRYIVDAKFIKTYKLI